VNVWAGTQLILTFYRLSSKPGTQKYQLREYPKPGRTLTYSSIRRMNRYIEAHKTWPVLSQYGILITVCNPQGDIVQ
jgi:hypothetical protein